MKFRKCRKVQPDSLSYCFQANNDQMLFFQNESDMNAYLCDYRKKIPLYKLSMFRVEFYNIK